MYHLVSPKCISLYHNIINKVIPLTMMILCKYYDDFVQIYSLSDKFDIVIMEFQQNLELVSLVQHTKE